MALNGKSQRGVRVRAVARARWSSHAAGLVRRCHQKGPESDHVHVAPAELFAHGRVWHSSAATLPATFCPRTCPQRTSDPMNWRNVSTLLARNPLCRNGLRYRTGVWGSGGRGFESRRPDCPDRRTTASHGGAVCRLCAHEVCTLGGSRHVYRRRTWAKSRAMRVVGESFCSRPLWRWVCRSEGIGAWCSDPAPRAHSVLHAHARVDGGNTPPAARWSMARCATCQERRQE